ncbi:MAG: FtsQ-type POTRA domain-containing protein [Defluviicoccus sp.]|nr:FtsQ-type POTRA domain-containing protein [Defluviicoccus sp.]
MWNAGLLDGYVADARLGLVGASARLGFRLREVLLVGRERVSRDAVLAASELDLGSPTLALDPESIRARLERNRWIKSARVTTRLPDTVFIEIEERRPLALWQRGGQLRMIDDEGAVIADRELHRYTHLPLVVTPSEPARAKPVLDMLAHEPDLERRVRALIEVGGRRWNIRLDNGIDVLLPETESAVAWSELAELDRRHALLARRVSAIDLRIPGRIVVTGIEDPEARGGTAKEAR